MRIFWVIFGVLAIAAVAWLIRPAVSGESAPVAERTDAPAPTPVHATAPAAPRAAADAQAEPAAPTAPPQTQGTVAGVENAGSGKIEPAPTPDSPPTTAPAAPGTQPPATTRETNPNTPPTEPPALAPHLAAPPASPATHDPTPGTQSRPDVSGPPALSATPPATAPAAATQTHPPAPTRTSAQAKTTVPPSAPANSEPGKPDALKAEPSKAAPVQPQPDGSLLIDGKYVIKGKGTKADPYILTWDQLVSAEEDYVPKDGRKKIPERIQMLNDHWIQITGYIAFPVMADSQDECLSMLNQWDGCCIGVPPTPYDAVEVHLREVAEGKDRMASYGTVRGRFKVDPQLVGGWLIGLYVMEDATMKPQTFGGIAP